MRPRASTSLRSIACSPGRSRNVIGGRIHSPTRAPSGDATPGWLPTDTFGLARATASVGSPGTSIAVVVVLAAKSYRRLPPRPVAAGAGLVGRSVRAVAVQRGDVAEAGFRPTAQRLGDRGEEAAGVRRHRAHRGLGDRAARRRRTSTRSTTAAPTGPRSASSGSPTNAPSQPPAPFERFDLGGEFVGPAERRGADRAPPRPTIAHPTASRNRTRRFDPADQRHADGDEHHRDRVAAEPGEPAEQRLDPTSERTGEVEVDGQPEQDPERRSARGRGTRVRVRRPPRASRCSPASAATPARRAAWRRGRSADARLRSALRCGSTSADRRARPGLSPRDDARPTRRLDERPSRAALLGRSPVGHGPSTVPTGGARPPLPCRTDASTLA